MFLYTPMPPVVTVMTFIYCLEPVTAALAFQAPEGTKKCLHRKYIYGSGCLFYLFAVECVSDWNTPNQLYFKIKNKKNTNYLFCMVIMVNSEQQRII